MYNSYMASLTIGGTLVADGLRAPELKTAAGDLVVQPATAVIDVKNSIIANVGGITGPAFNIVTGTAQTVGDTGYQAVVGVDTTLTPNASYTTRAYVTGAATDVGPVVKGATYEILANTLVDAGVVGAPTTITKSQCTSLAGTTDAQMAQTSPNIEVQVRGTAGLTINWEVQLYYNFQTA